MQQNDNNILIYQDDNGITKVNVRFSDKDVWLTQAQLAEIYDTTQENISMHIKNIYKDAELQVDRTYKDFLLVRQEGKRNVQRNIAHYNLDVIIYATSIDYDPRCDMTREFFTTVQNKLHYAVHEHTAAEVIYERVDSDKPMVGMTNFKGNYITKDDVTIAKNYLTEQELKRLNLLVSQFLDYAEFQALEMQEMRMADWVAALDNQIIMLKRKLLEGKGHISHKQAMEKAEKEFQIYRQREMSQLESDFDRMMKQLPKK